MTESTTLTERQFCEIVGISRTTAWRLRNAGKLAHCKIGTKILYLQRHVEDFLTMNERMAEATNGTSARVRSRKESTQ